MSTVIKAESIYKNYDSIVAVNNADIELETGKFYAVMGHSGSGKTTLIQILGLLDNFTDGRLLIGGKDASSLNENQKAEIRMNNIGFVFQSYYLNSKLKAYENVMLPMLINKKISNKKEKALSLLDALGLRDRAEHYPKELSGGEQQRVAIARALANDPICILADEPTGNLDTENELLVLDILKKISDSGKCVLLVSHNEIVKDYADTVFSMKNGILQEANE